MNADTQKTLFGLAFVVGIIALPYVIVAVGNMMEGPPKAKLVGVGEMNDKERLDNACQEVEALNDNLSGVKETAKPNLHLIPIRPELRPLHEMTCGW